MSATPIQTGDEVAVARPRIMLRFDPLLLLGALVDNLTGLAPS